MGVLQPDGITIGGQGSGLTATNYPRTVSIKRISALTANGDQGYRSDVSSLEVSVTGMQQVPADIQWRGGGPNPLAKVPDDSVGRGMWRVLIPIGYASPGQIQSGDVAVDDLGRRFKLNEPYLGQIDLIFDSELLRA